MSIPIKIEKGVPLSGRRSTGIKWIGLFRAMDVGDSFFVATADPRRDQETASAAWRVGRLSKAGLEGRFATRVVTENGVCGVRVWRVE
jgi:hypothetical protein